VGEAITDDRGIYERLSLEAFQSGLSWLTILHKRDNFREAFAGFEIETVAGFGARDVKRLMADAGIVRNRAKIDAVIANARAAAELDGALAELPWPHAPKSAGALLARARIYPPSPPSRRRSRTSSSGAASAFSARPPCTRRWRPAAS
jgi:DNA-3-methyladenine glycosylase I